MQKQNTWSFPKIYLIAIAVVSAFFTFLEAQPALAAACAGSGNDVTIAADCDLISGTSYTYTGLLTINTGVTVTVLYDVAFPGQTTITSDRISVLGNLSTNAQGFPAGEGTGAGTGTGGGGYGGAGGGTVGGGTYGSATNPTDLGSGGSVKAGGGSIHLVAGIVTINGVISSNGESSDGNGAGSGGSVWVETSTLSGSGSVTANGGIALTGGGGGGRISMSTEIYNFSGTISAAGGTPDGQNGTIRLSMTPPFIDTLTPSSTAAGTSSLVITIDGHNFETNATARLSGSDKTTAYVSPTQLTMTLGAADLNTAGVFSVTVHNPISGETSNVADLTLTNPVPILDGITPTTKDLGDHDLSVQLTGSNFLLNSLVYLDDALRASTYINPTTLNMNLIGADVADEGTHLIKVVNPLGGTSTAAALIVHQIPKGGGTGGVASPVAAGMPTPPIAGFGKALGPNSIRWYFMAGSNSQTGFQIVNSTDNFVLASSTNVLAQSIDETGLSASTTYCNRAIRGYNSAGLTSIQTNSIFPCATTLPIPMATSSAFTVSPLDILSIGVEDMSFGWHADLKEKNEGQLYGFYLPSFNSWFVPVSTSVTTAPTAGQSAAYKLDSTPFYQTIEQWGSDFKLIGLESETSYKFRIIRTSDPKVSGQGVWEFTASTTKGVITFDTEMQMIESVVEPTPTVSATLSTLGANAGRSWPSFVPAVLVGALALVYQKRLRRKPVKSKKVKKRRRVSAAVIFLIGAMTLAQATSVIALAKPAQAAGVTTLTYQLKFKNTGTKTAKNVVVNDLIPAGTLYYTGSMQVDGVGQTDAKDNDNAWYNDNPAQVNFVWATVAPGQEHSMRFTVYLKSGVTTEQVSNSAVMQPPDNSDPNTLPLVIKEQSFCGNSKIEVMTDKNGSPILLNGKEQMEVCDDGSNNGTGYGWCKSDCSGVDLPPSNLCGNGKIDQWINLKTKQTYKETCDDGTANGQVGKCNSTCNGTMPLPPKPPKEPEKKPEGAEQAAVTTTIASPTTTTQVVPELPTTTLPSPEVPGTSAPAVVGSSLADTVGNAINEGAKRTADVLAAPAVQQAGIPALGVITVLNIASTAGYVTLFNYLYFIFTQPLILIGRRKKQKYGVIYNSLSKLPVDLAAVRIKDQSGRIVQTKITDRQGRYSFLINKGQYLLDISKPNYIFPTTLLVNKAQDVDYTNLLTTNKLSYSSDSVVSNNIPLDPKEDTRLPKEVKRKIALRKLQGAAALLTTLLSVGALVLVPSYQYLGLVVFQVATYVVFRRLSFRKPTSSFGAVKDISTGKPIKNAIVRILDAQFNRILETQVTDSDGRYAFLVGKGKFYVTVTKDGYGQLRSDVLDYTAAKGPMVIDKVLKLKAA
ncbi:MAG: carboxypeptidase regulatory-like domain-containing protein [Methylococcales bacterium]|nr:carboxypeptidase regulatory-like domain-containing protein [Methylococcales bacterium]